MLRGVLVGFIALLGLGGTARADKLPLVGTVVHAIPRTHDELAVAHEQAAARMGVLVSPGKPLHVPHLTEQRVVRDARTAAGQLLDMPLTFDYSRHSFLAVGMDMTPGDQRTLPFFSGSTILDRVRRYYLCFGVHVKRDMSGQMYLDDRAHVAVADFSSAKSQPSIEMVDSSIRDLRGHGLFVRPDESLSDESLRTLVLINKSTLVKRDSQGRERYAPSYELTFVRALVDERDQGVELHVFTTANERAELHYLEPFAPPQSLADCGMKGTVTFTQYGFAGQLPSAKAIRQASVRSQSSISMDDFDRFAMQQNWTGGAFDHLTQALDAIIAGKLAGTTIKAKKE